MHQAQDKQPESGFWAYYTAKNINATDASRTAINANLAVGDVLVPDPYGHEQNDRDAAGAIIAGSGAKKGFAYTQPQTGFLNGKKAVVVREIPSGVNDLVAGSATQRKGGQVFVEPFAGAEGTVKILAKTHANMAAGTDYLGVANGDFGLVIKTSVASLAALAEVCALADETVNTSVTAAVKRVIAMA
jgi:hypothetical protein